MAIISNFPRKNFIPVREVKLTDRDFDVVKVLDHLSADYNDIFSRIGNNYTEFVITSAFEARIDLVANEVYGNNDLWWLIGYYNGIVNPVMELTIGKRLKIPRKEAVEFLLQANKKELNKRTVDIP